jgi:hypothetical protein
MQQIAIEVHSTVPAGPHTCEAPVPVQQYGAPEVQRFCAIGCWHLSFLAGSRLSWASRSGELGEDAFGEASATGIARVLGRRKRNRAER